MKIKASNIVDFLDFIVKDNIRKSIYTDVWIDPKSLFQLFIEYTILQMMKTNLCINNL